MSNCVNMIMQGDSYAIPFRIKSNGEFIDVSRVSRIEFTVGDLKKYYGGLNATVTYDATTHQFFFPLSQSESFNFGGYQKIQVRIKDTTNNVKGKIYGSIMIQLSDSEVVL